MARRTRPEPARHPSALSRRTFISGAAATVVLTVAVGAVVEGAASAATITKPAFRDASPHAAVKGRPYRYQFIASGSPRYTLAAGALPGRMTLNPLTGVLSGTPTAVGTASFRIGATNPAGHATTRPLKIHTAAGAPLAKPVNRVRPVISNMRPVVGERISVTTGTWS